MKIEGKKFTVIGMARSGIAAAEKLRKFGGNIFLSDNKNQDQISKADQLKKTYKCEFGGHTAKVFDSDTIIVSPGVPLNIPILEQARAREIELISEIELGYRLKANDSKLICCTGSNGKSTTVSLIQHLLLACGYNSILAGNIGTPFTACNIEKPGIDFIVLELSSFQLELIDKFKADIAIILNITPDHLDRYASFEHYTQAKFNIFKNQTHHNKAVLNLDDKPISFHADKLRSRKYWFSLKKQTDGCKTDSKLIVDQQEYNIPELSIQGPHNEMNCLAALLAISEYTRGKENQVKNALRTFKTLPHRLELAGIIRGIRFINDSKATNTDAVISALLSFTGNVHIILGGSDKGEDFSILIPFLRKKGIYTYLTGATRERMAEAFTGKLDFTENNSMEDAVRMAFERAKKDEVILLSPACASFDAFDNYQHRGDTFKKVVQELSHE